MTQRVEPSPGTAESHPLSGAIKHAFGRGFVVPSTKDLYAGAHPDISGTPLNAFDATTSTTSLDVTIDTGEAFVEGKWVARDTQATVSLPANSTTTVYVLWPADSGNDVRLTHEGATDYPTGAHGRLAIWTFTTDGSGVTGATDDRILDERMSVDADGTVRSHADLALDGALDGLSATAVSDLEGTNLSVDSNGILNSAGGADALSGLTIDVTKDWAGYGITGLGPLESTPLGSSDEFIYIEAGDNDPLIWRVGNNRNYGYQMQYTGSGSGNDNTLDLLTDDLNNAGRNHVWRIYQNGDINFGFEVTKQNDPLVSDATGTSYEIQKNGTDGAGVINFKT